jgi:hypothetical protein
VYSDEPILPYEIHTKQTQSREAVEFLCPLMRMATLPIVKYWDGIMGEKRKD